MNKLHNFRIKKEYITDVPNEKVITLYIPETGQTITGNSYGTIDHPEFAKLRDKLEKQGYIKTERLYWNGDTVTHPFTLNDMRFDVNETFPCASALCIKFSAQNKIKKRKTL